MSEQQVYDRSASEQREVMIIILRQIRDELKKLNEQSSG